MSDFVLKMPKTNQQIITGLATTYPAGTVIKSHYHSAHQIVHAIAGAMRVTAENLVWFLPLARALWIPAKVEHTIQCDGIVHMRTAYLNPSCLDAPHEVQMIFVSPLMREILVRLSSEKSREVDDLLCNLLLHEIHSGCISPFTIPVPKDSRIATLAEQLRNDPANKMSMTDFARQLGFSERSLIRMLRLETGLTFRELRRYSRIMVAIEKMAGGNSITQVALEVGFETPSAFSQAFKQVTGETPRKFLHKGKTASNPANN